MSGNRMLPCFDDFRCYDQWCEQSGNNSFFVNCCSPPNELFLLGVSRPYPCTLRPMLSQVNFMPMPPHCVFPGCGEWALSDFGGFECALAGGNGVSVTIDRA